MFLKTFFKVKYLQPVLKFHVRTFHKKSSTNPLRQMKETPPQDPQELLEDEIFSDNFKEKPPKTTETSLLNPEKNTKTDISNEIGDLSKKMDKEKMKFIRETLLYSGDDPFPEKLVERPEKGVVWGLGGELLKFRESE